MDSFLTIEWDDRSGIEGKVAINFVQEIGRLLKNKYYGDSITFIVAVITCLGHDLKRRNRYKKVSGHFEYYILLDYFLIKNVELEEKKKLIRYQMVKITEETFSKYKFEDFDKAAFLNDFKDIVYSVEL
ncbi:MAG TPA: hypothetical protein VNS32_22530 [Flavisolibacter sp.]|nr:hypothetical protein [Flavisolibacter sp.]